jgi:hypothetical protein
LRMAASPACDIAGQGGIWGNERIIDKVEDIIRFLSGSLSPSISPLRALRVFGVIFADV